MDLCRLAPPWPARQDRAMPDTPKTDTPKTDTPETNTPDWLASALAYLPRWLGHQMRTLEQPGVALAVAHRGALVLEHAIGHADLAAGIPLTPRHRFRVASHSKTFTAAGIMKLREQGRVTLEDRLGQHVDGPASRHRRGHARPGALAHAPASSATAPMPDTGWTAPPSPTRRRSRATSPNRRRSRPGCGSNTPITATRSPGA